MFVMLVAAGEMLRLQVASWQRNGNSIYLPYLTGRCRRLPLLEDCIKHAFVILRVPTDSYRLHLLVDYIMASREQTGEAEPRQ